jgi:CubicO group peptidase (beta-lactamase class C family)
MHVMIRTIIALAVAVSTAAIDGRTSSAELQLDRHPDGQPLVAVCMHPLSTKVKRQTIEVHPSVARLLVARGVAELGHCPTELMADDLELARITSSEQREEQSFRLLAPTVEPPLPIDDLTSIPPEAREMGRCIDEQYASEAEVGYAYAIVEDGQLAFSNAGGWARAPWETKAPSVPMTPAKPMTIASVSKPITAIAVMKLLEQNPGIDLDDPFYPLVEEKFSGQVAFDGGLIATMPGPGIEQVTIRNLLMHRSGLQPGLGCGYAKLAQLVATGLVSTPGVAYDYENSNFCMLREVIEQVSGLDYIDFVEGNVLGPMGIAGMSCEPEGTDPTLYYNTVGDPGYLWGGYSTTCSAYGWTASAVQLAAFATNVRFSTVLTSASTDEMLNASCQGSPGFSYCLGWIRSDGPIGIHRYHNGDWIDGDPCDVPGDPQDDLVLQPSTCPRGYNGTIMQLPLGVDAALLVNTRGGTGLSPGLKSEVTILRECFAEAFRDANDLSGGR